MSTQEDAIIDVEIRDYWWQQGDAVMREMTEDEDEQTTRNLRQTSKTGGREEVYIMNRNEFIYK